MHSCMFYPRLTRPQMVYIFIFCLSVRPLSGLVGEVASPPICLHLPSSASGICSSVIFGFTRCIPTPWIFACTVFSAIYDLDIHLWALLRSFGSFDFSMFPTFLEGAPKLSAIFQSFPRDLACLSCPISLGISDLVSRSSTFWSLVWWRFFGIFLVPQFLVMRVTSKFSARPDLLLQATSQKVYSLIFFSLSHDEEGFDGLLPFSLTEILVYLSFLIILEYERIK